MTSESSRVRAALLTVQLIFATWPVVAKLVLETLEPFALAWIRIVFAALFFGAIALAQKGAWPPLKEGLKIAGIGVMGTAMNQLLYLGGLQQTEASHAAVLVTMIPVFAFVIALVTGRERFSPLRSLGVLVALVGALSLTGIGPLLEGTNGALGDALLIANCAAYAVYLVYSKPYVKKYGTIKVLALAFGASVFVAAPFGAPGVSTALMLDGKGAMLLVYILIAPTALAYLLNAWALRRADASTVAIYIYLQPIAGVLLAANVLGDALDGRIVISALLIFVGIALVTRRSTAERTS